MGENKKSIGAFWLRIGKNSAKEYMSGTLNIDGKDLKVIAFKNDNKKNDKEPDWRIYPSDYKGANNAVPMQPQNNVAPKNEEPIDITTFF